MCPVYKANRALWITSGPGLASIVCRPGGRLAAEGDGGVRAGRGWTITCPPPFPSPWRPRRQRRRGPNLDERFSLPPDIDANAALRRLLVLPRPVGTRRGC